MLITGQCHCGRISFTLDWWPEPERIPARACTCSFCRKHGGLWTSCPTGALEVRMKDAAGVQRYAFGTRTAVFHVCGDCGVVPVVTSEIGGRVYAVVSVRAFDNVDPAMLQQAEVSFEGEEQEDRLARRQRNWIPEVRFVDIAGGAASPP